MESPLFAVMVTVVGYRIGLEVRRKSRGHSLAQPVLVAIVVVAVVLQALDIDYATYLQGGQYVAFLLGPATVALAVPLYRQLRQLSGLVVPLLVALPVGALASVALGYFLVTWLGGGEELALTMAPKSATTPVSLAVSEVAGGIGPLTAVFAIVAGIIGAVAAPTVLTWARIRDRRARGLAMGAVSHGVGTSRSLLENETEGAFSGLSMGLSALFVSLLMPVFLLVV